MLSKSKQSFEQRMHTATKKGLFNFADPNYSEEIALDTPIPQFALLQDVAFIVRVAPKLAGNSVNTAIAVGVTGQKGCIVGKGSNASNIGLANTVNGQPLHPKSLFNYGSFLIETPNTVPVRKPYFFKDAGLSSIQLNMSFDAYDNADFEIDICLLCLELV